MIVTVQSHIKEEDLLAMVNAILSSQFDHISLGKWRNFDFSAQHVVVQDISVEENITTLKFICDIETQSSNEAGTIIGKLLVECSIPVQIDANAIARSQISIKTLKWLEGPKIDLGLFELNLNGFTNKLLSVFNQSMEQKVSKKLSQELNLGLQTAILKMKKTNASMTIQDGLYLSMVPNSIYLYPFQEDGEQIITCQLHGDYFIGEVQQNIPEDWAPIIAFSSSPKTSDFQFDFQISHSQLGRIIKQNLIGRSLDIKGKSISVSDVNYKFNNSQHEVELDIEGDMSARLMAYFQILFNQDKQLFYLDLKSFELKPKNWLHRLLVRAFKQKIINDIEEKGRIQVNDLMLGKLNNNFNQFLKSKLSEMGIHPKGTVSQLIVEDFNIKASGLMARLRIRLDINLAVTSREKLLHLYQKRMH
ncbi:MAG: DUF4403 family protein [Saprospiraceae bacterium]|nr:DUF4403 family protein [Saprospiraceae bacterium]